MKDNYKFDPLKYGYINASQFPMLSYRFPMNSDKHFIKIIDSHEDRIFWYSAIFTGVGIGDSDDRIQITSYTHNSSHSDEMNLDSIYHVKYLGLISTHNFALDLLSNIFGTTTNDSVESVGIDRLNDNTLTLKYSNIMNEEKLKKLSDMSAILTWVFYGSEGVTDNTDLMRANMLCMNICNKSLPNVDEIMNSVGYKSCLNDIPANLLTKEYIQKIVDFRNDELNK